MQTDESYYAAVESYFVERRGSPLFITPGEWQLVWKWEQQGIPLHVVRAGIDRVFERPRARQKPRKLGYCRQTVEAAFRRYRESSLGARGDAGPEEAFDAEAHLRDLASRLRRLDLGAYPKASGLAACLADTAVRIDELADQVDGASPEAFADLESTLTAMEDRLLETAESAIGDQVRSELLREARASLESYRERMPEKVYRSAEKSAYRRRLRKQLGLIRLSLFDR